MSYRYFLERLAQRGYLIVATPHDLSFDHLKAFKVHVVTKKLLGVCTRYTMRTIGGNPRYSNSARVQAKSRTEKNFFPPGALKDVSL